MMVVCWGRVVCGGSVILKIKLGGSKIGFEENDFYNNNDNDVSGLRPRLPSNALPSHPFQVFKKIWHMVFMVQIVFIVL